MAVSPGIWPPMVGSARPRDTQRRS